MYKIQDLNHLKANRRKAAEQVTWAIPQYVCPEEPPVTNTCMDKLLAKFKNTRAV
jgi:hypothetical protein